MAKVTGAIAQGTWSIHTPLNAVTETTTSSTLNIAGAKRISLAFTRANHSSGASAFKIQVSVDGTTFIDFNKLITNVANTNGQTETRVTTVSLSSNTTEFATVDLDKSVYKAMKVVVTETTDGTHTAKALITY